RRSRRGPGSAYSRCRSRRAMPGGRQSPGYLTIERAVPAATLITRQPVTDGPVWPRTVDYSQPIPSSSATVCHLGNRALAFGEVGLQLDDGSRQGCDLLLELGRPNRQLLTLLAQQLGVLGKCSVPGMGFAQLRLQRL